MYNGYHIVHNTMNHFYFPVRFRGSRVFADVSPAASLHSLPTIHSTSHLDKSIKNGEPVMPTITSPAHLENTSQNADPVSAV